MFRKTDRDEEDDQFDDFESESSHTISYRQPSVYQYSQYLRDSTMKGTFICDCLGTIIDSTEIKAQMSI